MKEENNKEMALLEAENQSLRLEIQRLQKLLDCAGIQYAVPEKPQEILSGIEKSEGIINENITTEQIDLFITLFHGRTDVYAKRFVNKAGNVGYSPGCSHFWRQGVCPKRDGQKIKCFDCPGRSWIKLNRRLLREHLKGHKPDGTDVIGIYPMLADETCYFIVFILIIMIRKKRHTRMRVQILIIHGLRMSMLCGRFVRQMVLML